MQNVYSIFNPTQPEMITNCHLYKEFSLKNYEETDVTLFYQFNTNEHEILTPVIPDGCIDLLFNLNSTTPSAFVAVSPEKRSSELFEKNAEYFGVRLNPLQSKLSFKCSKREIIHHKKLSLFEVSYLNESILEELANINDFNKRMIWFLSLLNTKTVEEMDYDKRFINYCLNRIYLSNGLVKINDLSDETGYSARYLRKKFEEYVGFSPKQFSTIVRLQFSIDKLMKDENYQNHLVDEHVYYDKSHFYREFKKYILLTPHEYKEVVCSSKSKRN